MEKRYIVEYEYELYTCNSDGEWTRHHIYVKEMDLTKERAEKEYNYLFDIDDTDYTRKYLYKKIIEQD